MTKWKIGTRVVPTKECIAWYRQHLLKNMHVGGSVRPEDAPQALLWAAADLEIPEGRVISGTPACPDTSIRVCWKSSFGTYEHYIEKDFVLKRGAK